MNAAASKPALAKKQAQPDYSRRDELITEHLHLVRAIAAHIQKSIPVHVELDDLVHAGTMGLFDAATKYCDEKEVAFSTYAKHRIRGAILDSLREIDWASRDLRKKYRQVEAVKTELNSRLGRMPTDAEIASEMGLSERRWQVLMVDFRNLGAAATQARNNERDDLPIQEPSSSPAQNPDQIFARIEIQQKLRSALKTLPERYQEVVQLYYHRDMTMKEIGGVLGVNESRISQIHKSALDRMQAVLGASGICSAAAFC